MGIAHSVVIAGRGPGGTPLAIGVTADGELLVADAAAGAVNNPTVFNLTLAAANTEYSIALPANTRYFEFQCRTGYDIRYQFEPGHVAASVAPYMTLKAEDYVYSGLVSLDGVWTVYFASATAGAVVELLAWS